ncbi:peptidylprolyl isomerase [Peptoniphilus sp. GNH]|nr:peptidylprolyl isomerase PrsA1 family protein [Clostridiales bacterium KA00134]UHR02840.1 peptidylprolyl isomerase [Peptoniphilus sp. GNH]
MKVKSKILATALLSMSLVLTACSKKQANGVDGVVAKVNDKNITLEQYVEEYAAQKNMIILGSKAQGQDPEEFFKQPDPKTGVPMGMKLREIVLKNLEQAEIIRQELEKEGYTVNPQDVQNQIDKYIESYGSKEAFENELKKQGYTEEFLRNYASNQIMFNEFYNRFSKNFKADDAEIKAAYEKNKDKYMTYNADHILVNDENLAKDIKKQLSEGADFAELAKKHSKDKSNAEKGGNLGDFTKGTMVKEFEAALDKLKEGEISDPVKTSFGYHIIKLNKKGVKDLSEVKDQIKQSLEQEKFDKWANDLEKNAKIEEFLDLKKEVDIPEKYQLEDKGEDKAENQDKKDKKTEEKPAENEKAADKSDKNKK